MSALAFVTHPSVRIKGTENAYSPTMCLDERCPIKAPHLHCPLCVKTDAYQDPVILKAHYRVKHVDKGIDFAGLKVLRCCDNCDIVGIIKGEKKFKGAHWHCYRCRNGFNRRDEAIKHYKTHFRNPQTTFQIQITQDINSPPEQRSQDEHSTSIPEGFCTVQNTMPSIVRNQLPQVKDQLSDQVNKVIHSTVGLQKVKSEALEKEDSGGQEGEKTIMIIQGTQLENALAGHIIDPEDLTQLEKSHVDHSLSWEIRCRMEEEEKNIYKEKMEDYKLQVEVLKQQVSDLETQLAQQRQICFHELLELLASENQVQRQAASDQVAKFLEQCQACLPSGSLPLLRETSAGLQVGESIQQEKQGDESSPSMHDLCQEQKSQPQIASLAEELQVMCDPEVAEIEEGVSHATEPGTDLVTTAIQHQTQEVGEASPLFAHMVAHRQQVQVVLPEVVHSDPTGQGLDNSASPDDPQGETTAMMNPECLMEVVAANGLASLGTDMTVINSSTDDNPHTRGTFIMTLEDGQKLILHQAADTCSDGEPDKKRAKVS